MSECMKLSSPNGKMPLIMKIASMIRKGIAKESRQAQLLLIHLPGEGGSEAAVLDGLLRAARPAVIVFMNFIFVVVPPEL